MRGKRSPDDVELGAKLDVLGVELVIVAESVVIVGVDVVLGIVLFALLEMDTVLVDLAVWLLRVGVVNSESALEIADKAAVEPEIGTDIIGGVALVVIGLATVEDEVEFESVDEMLEVEEADAVVGPVAYVVVPFQTK